MRKKVAFILLLLALIGGATPKTAYADWNCDEPEAWMYEDCANGDCTGLWLWNSWRAQNCN